MNACLNTVKDSILIHNETIEIHHDEAIQTIEAYDVALACALKYLNDEGFLDNHPYKHVHVIDSTGKQIIREQFS